MRQILINKLKEEKGFTLIELLAVIVILGIIAAIAIPSIGKVIENSKNDAVVAEALSIIDAARLAHTENNADTKWKHTADTTNGFKALSSYVSKVKDTAYEVTLNPDTNVYTIKHEAASIKNKAGTVIGTNGTVTEDILAAQARE
jgi:type IV pilus assembly protein PilA